MSAVSLGRRALAGAACAAPAAFTIPGGADHDLARAWGHLQALDAELDALGDFPPVSVMAPAVDRIDAVLRQVAATRPTTARGLAEKARIAQHYADTVAGDQVGAALWHDLIVLGGLGT